MSLTDFTESWSDRTKLRFMGGIAVLLILFSVTACNETRYMVWGQTVAAKFEKAEAYTTRGRYGSSSPKLAISYSFQDGELGTRKEEDEIPADWLTGRTEVLPGDGTVNVQYIPGSLERSRLIGHNRRWLIWPFLGCCAVVTFFGVRFWIDFKDHERRSNAASALYKR